MPIELNALETARFGITAAWVTDVEATPDEIDAAARDKGVQMLTCRIDVGDLPRVHALEAANYHLMDTLVYYGRDLGDTPPRFTSLENVHFRQALPKDATAVARVAQAGFADYMGHYHADPRLDSTASDAAYVEWAATSTERTSANAPVLIAELDGQIAGFLTLRRNSPKEAEIVLNAVHPKYQGRGLYGALVCESLSQIKATGAVRMITSTQINNYAVQRIWARLGFMHERSLYTFHKWL